MAASVVSTARLAGPVAGTVERGRSTSARAFKKAITLLRSSRLTSKGKHLGTKHGQHLRDARGESRRHGELQPLSAHFCVWYRPSKAIPAGVRQARDQPLADGIVTADHHDGDRRGRALGRQRTERRVTDEDVRLKLDELGGK